MQIRVFTESGCDCSCAGLSCAVQCQTETRLGQARPGTEAGNCNDAQHNYTYRHKQDAGPNSSLLNGAGARMKTAAYPLSNVSRME